MSSEDYKFRCASCGLTLEESPDIIKNRHSLCPLCMSNDTKESEFQYIVYAVAIGYFMNKKQIQDPIEALYRAHTVVSQLPYWQDKICPPPSLEGLKTARMLIAVTLKMVGFKKELPEFFISYNRTGSVSKFIEPLVIALKEYGYDSIYAEDSEKIEAEIKSDPADKKIQHAQFYVPILCQDYFTIEGCMNELKNIICAINPKNVFPVWWKDVNSVFLKQQELGENILDLIGVGWKNWQGNIKQLANALVQLAHHAQGLKKYNKQPLVVIEAQILEELERLINEAIPPLDAKDLETATFGFYAEKNRITALFLEEKELKSLPENFGLCFALKMLSLANNKLVALPENFGQCLALRTLNLENNNLITLPESFSKI
ncbi:MAG: hypothetical protein ACFFBD_03920 [Candidatus Hodarchaeota archaeon]